MSSSSLSSSSLSLTLPVFFHSLDPKPEQAFTKLLPSENFFEYKERIAAILAILQRHPQRYSMNELTQFDAMDVKKQVLRVHDARYIHWLENVYAEAKQPVVADTFPSSPYGARYPAKSPLQLLAGYWAFDSWTPVVERTFEAAMLSTACAVMAARELLSGRTRLAYAVCRPPGHHAGPARFGGYCYINSAGVAARQLQAEHPQGGKPRVTIFDCDYHHGNGTQDIFYEDATVQYVSIHADPEAGGEPFYVGYAEETGAGAGVGTNVNIPLPPSINDEIYGGALQTAMDSIRAFQPSYVVVSLGVDIFQDDPLSLFGGITMDMFANVGRALAELNVPTLIVQEGGYNVDATGPCVHRFFDGFLSA